MCGLGKGSVGSVGVSVARLGADVVGCTVAKGRCSGCRGVCHSRHSGQVLVIHIDGFRSVARLLQSLCHHSHYGLADKAHSLMRQRAAIGSRSGLAPGTLEVRAARHMFDPRRNQLRTCPHRQHAGHGKRSGCVDGCNACMRVRGP